MSIIWKDTSSFSQGDKERIPKCFRASVGFLTLTVHRHIHYEKDDWLLSVVGIFDNKVVSKGSSDDAKEVAVALVKATLEKVLEEFDK